MADDAFKFGGMSIPADCKRLYITAELHPANGDPRIQPTGFPDIGPVFYPDPSGDHGRICLIESEPSMANLLEDVCLADSLEDKAVGKLRKELSGLPYVKVTENGAFKTASTIDGHRFASAHIMLKAKGTIGNDELEIVEYIKRELKSDGKRVAAEDVSRIYQIVMELDPMALIHGFQISNDKFTFVGCRSPRAIIGCIVGLDTQLVRVPGVRLDPLEKESGQAGQAIFSKERIVAAKIEARFSIDIGLLRSMPVAGLLPRTDSGDQNEVELAALRSKRQELLVALSLWKVAKFLKELEGGYRRRSECDLALKSVKYRTKQVNDAGSNSDPDFPFESILAAGKKDGDEASKLGTLITDCKFPENRSPLELRTGGSAQSAPEKTEEGNGDADDQD